MQTERFDAVIIGAGQGGTPLSKALAQHGWRTALVERRMVGGTCLNDGCVPTKTYIASARVAALARRGSEFGIRCGEISTDMRAVKQRKDALLGAGRKSIHQSLTQQTNLDLIDGTGCFAEQQAGGLDFIIEVSLNSGGSRLLRSPRVFLDVGARPQLPDVQGIEAVPYLTSTSILELEEAPQHLVILGGGYVAVEFAQTFRRFGSKVTVVQRGTSLLRHEDDDIVSCLTGILREDSIDVMLNADTASVQLEGAGVALQVNLEGEQHKVCASHLLVATGRTPNTELLHLDRVGVSVMKQGTIEVNEFLETTRPGIWALGDVKGGPAFTHVSYNDFRVLEANLIQGKARSTKSRLIPYCIFTDPELGRVGLTEKAAREAGYEASVGTITMDKVARAREMSEMRGMLKAVVDRSSGKLLGVACLCVNGGEIATQLQFAMLGGLTEQSIEEAIIAHPVLAEGLHPLFRALH